MAGGLKAGHARRTAGKIRTTLLGKVVRQLGALGRRVSRVAARDTLPGDCASTLDGLIESAQALARALAD